MRTYQSHGPRLSAERALHQVQRGRLPQCPRCNHPAIAHACNDKGQRVCTRGRGLVACRECAHVQAEMREPTRGVFYLAETFRLAGQGADVWKPLVL